LGERAGPAHRRHRGSAATLHDPALAGRGGRQGRVFRKFSPVTTPRSDGVHVDLNLDYTTSESPDMRRVPAWC
jgi:hypothetical protein